MTGKRQRTSFCDPCGSGVVCIGAPGQTHKREQFESPGGQTLFLRATQLLYGLFRLEEVRETSEQREFSASVRDAV